MQVISPDEKKKGLCDALPSKNFIAQIEGGLHQFPTATLRLHDVRTYNAIYELGYTYATSVVLVCEAVRQLGQGSNMRAEYWSGLAKVRPSGWVAAEVDSHDNH